MGATNFSTLLEAFQQRVNGVRTDAQSQRMELLLRDLTSAAEDLAVADREIRAQQAALSTVLLGLFTLVAGTDPQKVLQETAYLVAGALPAGSAVSLVLGSPTDPTAVASSGPSAQQLDKRQLEAVRGPSLDAFSSHTTVVAVDLKGELRGSAPTAAGGDLGLVSAIAVPLKRGGDLDGVLTAYLSRPATRHPELRENVEILAACVGLLLQELSLRTHLERLTHEMHDALASRSTIEQAKGIVMAAKHCTADEAFQHLVSLSNTSHLKLRDVAQQVVEGAGG